MRSLIARAAGPLLLLSCGDPVPVVVTPARDKPLVCTTLYPVQYFAERIAGDLAEVECVVDPGADPLHWRPDRAMIQLLQGADLVLLNGAGAEPWLFQVSLPMTRVVETAGPLSEQLIQIEDAVTHSHGPGDTHTHEGTDPHTWTDPKAAKVQAEQVLAGLLTVLPDQAEKLKIRHDELAAELGALHDSFAALGNVPEGETLVASHPAYNYLARTHGWPIVNFDLTVDNLPFTLQ